MSGTSPARASAPIGARHLLTLLRRVAEVRRIVHLTAAMQPAERTTA
jgi:hypothetical protein